MTATATETRTVTGFELGVCREDALVLITHVDPATLTLPPVSDPDWHDQVACAGRASDFDVAEDNLDATLRALVDCSTCPVMAECRNYALLHDVSGVAGGLTRDVRGAWQRLNRIRIASSAEYVGEEVASLDAIAEIDYTKNGHGTARQRAETVMLLANRGHNANQIAALLDCNVRSVNRLVGIAVHHYGMLLGPDAVITVSAQPPKSIEHRGELHPEETPTAFELDEDYDDEFDYEFISELAGELTGQAVNA